MNDEGVPNQANEFFRTPGFAWRVGVSILVVFGWLAFVIIWLFFYAGDFDVWQNIAVLLVSIIIGIGILAAAWASWGIKYASKFGGDKAECKKPTGASVINAIAGIGWLIFLIIWLFYYADDYSGYQNLAIFITSVLVLGAVTGSIWVVRWIRTPKR